MFDHNIIVINSKGEIRHYFPTFEIYSNITINMSDLKNRMAGKADDDV